MDDIKKPKKDSPVKPSEDFGKPKIDLNHPDLENNYEVKSKHIQNKETIETIELDDPDAKKVLISNKMKKTKKKKKILVSMLLIITMLFIGIIAYLIFGQKDNNSNVQDNQVVTKEIRKVPTSPLTGRELTDASLANRPITAVMIENSPNARPQSGLIDSDIVYEAVAEAGITRFMALYQESQPQYIGPIRSVRAYYLDYAMPYQAAIAHVGGSPEALNDIKSLGVRDLDQFYNESGYWRINERYAPHNMYSSFVRLDKLNQEKGFNYSKINSFDRKKDVPQTISASIIDLSISGPLYSPQFRYNPTTNKYDRYQAGSPHIDQKSGQVISPNTVVALVVPNGVGSDGYLSTYNTSGSGPVYVFQDGIVSVGTWSKADRKSPLELKDSNGLSMKLNTGQTWVSLVGSSTNIVYRP